MLKSIYPPDFGDVWFHVWSN